MNNRAHNAPTGEYYPTQPCPDCGEPVFVSVRGVFDATGTTTGPFTRLGFQRHPADIARSVHHDRAEGFARHSCPNLPKDSA